MTFASSLSLAFRLPKIITFSSFLDPWLRLLQRDIFSAEPSVVCTNDMSRLRYSLHVRMNKEEIIYLSKELI